MLNDNDIWITDLAIKLAKDSDSVVLLAKKLNQCLKRLQQQQKLGVEAKHYRALEGSYEAVRIAIKFLHKYRAKQLEKYDASL